MPERENWPDKWAVPGLPGYPREDCRKIDAKAAAVYAGSLQEDFVGACREFYLYRYLHWNSGMAEGLLLGDYYFSLFSHRLIPLDSVALTEAFSDYLAENTVAPLDLEDYLQFVERLKTVID